MRLASRAAHERLAVVRRRRRYASLLCLAALCLAATRGGGLDAAAAAGKSFFFATRQACAASGLFDQKQCANAFANALAEMRERAPSFATRIDCHLRFGLCEKREIDAAAPPGVGVRGRFAPVMLGVEIFDRIGGGVAAPVLAVANPRGLFRERTIRRLDVARPSAAPGDVGGTKPDPGAAAPSVPPPPPGDAGRVEADNDSGSRKPSDAETPRRSETPDQRRERLRNAPFIE